jgi:hypothetical protein
MGFGYFKYSIIGLAFLAFSKIPRVWVLAKNHTTIFIKYYRKIGT